MEELRSTEILDKEIQSDARKKAEKILKTAEEESKELLSSVSSRISKAESEKKQKNAERLASFKKDLDAALPLEKSRFLLSFLQSSIDKSMDEYFSSLSEDELLDVFMNRLSVLSKGVEGKNKIESKKVKCFFYGLNEASLKKKLEKRLSISSIEKTEFNKIIPEKDFGLSCKKGVIIETEDGEIRIRLTVSEIVDYLEEKYREELSASLFEGRL